MDQLANRDSKFQPALRTNDKKGRMALWLRNWTGMQETQFQALPLTSNMILKRYGCASGVFLCIEVVCYLVACIVGGGGGETPPFPRFCKRQEFALYFFTKLISWYLRLVCLY
ncbi:unnamed protein product [Caretta caretta]